MGKARCSARGGQAGVPTDKDLARRSATQALRRIQHHTDRRLEQQTIKDVAKDRFVFAQPAGNDGPVTDHRVPRDDLIEHCGFAAGGFDVTRDAVSLQDLTHFDCFGLKLFTGGFPGFLPMLRNRKGPGRRA
ncbi:MAG: hypothetical protein GKR99_03370 [Rhodobacteraceae bacterium]|nr:hypothetical protein [Paracoccaceae bacterium]